MKKTGLIFTMIITMLTGTAGINEVSADCVTVAIDCNNGKGTVTSACGTTEQVAEIIKEVIEITC
ncbi:hypothetical protein [Thermophagus xiamenensis]|uniref:hypothetical protein n=1 Tax=Thermophagus xiamenensis TaxID=385682 RepID=UPI000255CF30|nr:hypothetical protein [Thermophagus xiamenensis]